MMTTTINMTFGSVVLGLLLFVIPIYTLYLLRVDVWRKALKALGRMVVALGAAALLTQAALWLSNIAFTLLCAVVMVAVTAAAMVARSRIRQPRFVVPVALGLLLTAVPLGLYFVFLVLGVGTPLTPATFCPPWAWWSEPCQMLTPRPWVPITMGCATMPVSTSIS